MSTKTERNRPEDEGERLMTAGEIAAIYQVHKNTVHQWHRDGLIPAEVAVGKIVRFKAAAVAKALQKETRRQEAAPRTPGMVMVI